MTFPSSGAISASDINTQFGRAAGTAVTLSDVAIRSVGSNSGVGTAFSYNSLYGKSPKWLFSQLTTLQPQSAVYATCSPIASANGSSFVSNFYDSNNSYSYVTRAYLNGDIIARRVFPLAVSTQQWNSDSSGNLYMFFTTQFVKLDSALNTSAATTWSYGGDSSFNSYIMVSTNASGILPNSAFYAGNTFTSGSSTVSVILKTDTSLTNLWSKSITMSSSGWYIPVVQYLAHDNNDNCYAVVRVEARSGGVYQGILKLNSSGTQQFQQMFLRANPQACHLNSVASNSAGTQLVAAGNYNATTPSTCTGIVVSSLNPSTGAISWIKAFYTTNYSTTAVDTSASICIDDATGDIYVASYVAEQTTSGLWGYGAVYLLKLNSSGTLQWQRAWQLSGTSAVGDATSCDLPYLSFANGILRLSFCCGIAGEYGIEPVGVQVFQVPLDGSGTGTYDPYGNSARLLRYSAGTLTEVTPTSPATTTGISVNTATSVLTSSSFSATSANANARGLINI